MKIILKKGFAKQSPNIHISKDSTVTVTDQDGNEWREPKDYEVADVTNPSKLELVLTSGISVYFSYD